MHSSISNSDARRPDINYGKLWIATGVILLAIFGVCEIKARIHGISPSLVDNYPLWQYVRDGMKQGEASKNQIVVMGASRAHLGFDIPTYKEETGSDVVMLAIGGANTWPLLRDIAENTDFRGTVVYSFRGDSCYRTGSEAQMARNILDYKRNYGNYGKYEKILNKKIEMFVQGNFAVVHIKPDDLNKLLFSPTRARTRNYLVIGPGRSARAHYRDMVDPKSLAKKRRSRVEDIREYYNDNLLPDPQWEEHMREVGQWVKEIQDRGGRVVLVRFPTSGEHWELDNSVYPREKYWDRLAGLTGATTIHFKDMSGFENVDCPDTSHLDYEDAKEFTKALAKKLKRPQ